MVEPLRPLGPEVPDYIIDGIDVRLDSIRRIVLRWMEFDRTQREKEGLDTFDNTHIMSPPTWPTHGQLKNWVKCLDEAMRQAQAASERLS